MKLLCALALPILVFGHGGEKHTQKNEPPKKIEIKNNKQMINTEINNQYLKNIKPIFEKKCFDCHSNKTVYPWYFKLPIISGIIKKDIQKAKEHLDFSNDFPFVSHESPQKDLISILETFKKKSMPPKQYTIMHNDSKITDTDISTIETWVDKSLKKMNKE